MRRWMCDIFLGIDGGVRVEGSWNFIVRSSWPEINSLEEG